MRGHCTNLSRDKLQRTRQSLAAIRLRQEFRPDRETDLRQLLPRTICMGICDRFPQSLFDTQDAQRGFVNTAKAFDAEVEPPPLRFDGF